jgi:muramidase (phage lysozyme)
MIGYNGFENLVWFMGLVEDIEDPYNGRVRVRCFGFHPTLDQGGVEKEDLPWAHIVRDSKFTSMPDEGDLVIGFFMDGRDAQHPMVIGSINSAKFSLPTIAGVRLPDYVGSQPNANPMSVGRAANENLEPHQRAFLDAIAAKESGGRYDVLNGGGTFDPSLPHPNKVGPGGTSTAAGRYQFTYGTWKDISGNAPMNANNQDYYAWQLAKQRYKAYTGGDLDAYIKSNGVTSELLTSLSPTWAAFGSTKDHPSIISTFNKSLSTIGGSDVGFEQSGRNPYMPPSQDAISNYGQAGMPWQFHGEGIERSPLLTQATFRKVTTAGEFTIDEPLRPVAANVKTSVWSTRYHGSHIELAGSTDDSEFISITHTSGSHITLDAHGNITIKSFGRTHNSTEGDMQEVVGGSKMGVYEKGYGLYVSGGKCVIQTSGDLDLYAGGDINMSAGGKLAINVGDSIDIAGSRIAATARVDNIDLLSIGKMSIEARAGQVGIKGNTKVAIESAAGIDISAAAMTKLGGSEIHLNSPDNAPDTAAVAIAANVPAAIPRGMSAPTEHSPTPPQSNPLTPDNPTGTMA